MVKAQISDAAMKNHSQLMESFLSLNHDEGSDRSIQFLDGTEKGACIGPIDMRIRLGHCSQPSIARQGAGHLTLSYPPDSLQSAMAALCAIAAGDRGAVYDDPSSHAIFALATRVARSTVPVLIEGPTGTGKEVLARTIHQSSMRRDGPFVAVNCAAMPESMLEAMLFGHRKGAFTGASEAVQGFFRAADGGALLLDEIGEMPIALQAKLLRALQEREVVPIGASQPVKVDVRIVASTNRDLPAEIQSGRFREDLYYRLNVFPLHLEALRDRPGDIAPLAFAMLCRHSGGNGDPTWIDNAALNKLIAHSWPGNVRELENVIRRALVLAHGERQILADHIRFDAAVRAIAPVSGSATAPQPGLSRCGAGNLSDIAFQSEAEAILAALNECHGHRRKTANQLGISERTLRYRLADMRDAGMAIAGARS